MMVKHQGVYFVFHDGVHRGVYFVFHDGEASGSVFCISWW